MQILLFLFFNPKKKQTTKPINKKTSSFFLGGLKFQHNWTKVTQLNNNYELSHPWRNSAATTTKTKHHEIHHKWKEKKPPKPAALLTKPLPNPTHKHNLGLSMLLTHLVPPMVWLSITQISCALLSLTTPHPIRCSTPTFLSIISKTNTTHHPFLPLLLLLQTLQFLIRRLHHRLLLHRLLLLLHPLVIPISLTKTHDDSLTLNKKSERRSWKKSVLQKKDINEWSVQLGRGVRVGVTEWEMNYSWNMKK